MTTQRDIVDVLTDEHALIRERIEALKSTPRDHREAPFHTLVAHLASHEAAEEAVVHRALRDEAPGNDDLVDEVLGQEAAAEELLDTMIDHDPTSEQFAQDLDQLEQAVLAHAEHEEQHEFPALRTHLSARRLQELATRFHQLDALGPTRPHPQTPQDPSVRAAVGPLVGMFDRARDRVRGAAEG